MMMNLMMIDRNKMGLHQNQGSWIRVFHRDVARQHTPVVADFLSEDYNDKDDSLRPCNLIFYFIIIKHCVEGCYTTKIQFNEGFHIRDAC